MSLIFDKAEDGKQPAAGEQNTAREDQSCYDTWIQVMPAEDYLTHFLILLLYPRRLAVGEERISSCLHLQASVSP